MSKKFGKLEKVDLHELWNGGATDFTPWLSQEENLAELGNVLGMELEIQEQEQKPGTFHPDILCKDVLTDHFVLIENQMEKTDHAHLGQLMTCAAGRESATIVWVAGAFAEEHWAALAWLNNITDESINFYGVELDAFKIGDSLPATVFNIVVKPDGRARQVKKATSDQKATDVKRLQQEYWQGLKDYLEGNNSFVKLPNPPLNNLVNIPLGRSKYFLSVALNQKDISLNVWLVIIGEKAKKDFDRLYEVAYKDSLIEVNQNLIWDRMEADIRSGVTLKTYADYTEKNDWPNQFAWFKENLEKFDRYFRARVKDL